MSGAPEGAVEILVCVKCRQGQPAGTVGLRPGAWLHAALADRNLPADIVLLTKPDLAGPAGVTTARATIEAEAPHKLPIIEVAEGAVDPRVILGLEAAAEDDLHARPSHHDDAHDHDHDDFESVVVELPEQADPAILAGRIEALARGRNILRVKGYAAVQGKPMRLLVQAVGARVRHQYDRPWGAEEPRATRLVVIAEHDDIDARAIRAALEG